MDATTMARLVFCGTLLDPMDFGPLRLPLRHRFSLRHRVAAVRKLVSPYLFPPYKLPSVVASLLRVPVENGHLAEQQERPDQDRSSAYRSALRTSSPRC